MRLLLAVSLLLGGCATPQTAAVEGVYVVARSVSDDWLRGPLLAVSDETIMVEAEGAPRCMGREKLMTLKLRLGRETAPKSVGFGSWSLLGAVVEVTQEEVSPTYFAPVDLGRVGSLKRLARFPDGAPFLCPGFEPQQFMQP